MELRDFFAGQALAGMLAHPDTELDQSSVDTLVPYMWDVYKVADAMLAARNAQISEQAESPSDSPASPVQQLQAKIAAKMKQLHEYYQPSEQFSRDAVITMLRQLSAVQ